MQEYKNKQELIDEISKRAKLFIDEFSDIPETDRNELIDGVDRTPAQMIAYQLGWMNLIWKYIHINTVAPFKSFRTKIRKWKKLNQC